MYFITKGARTIGFLDEKKKFWSPTSHHYKISSQSGLRKKCEWQNSKAAS